jgi:hypothetical protein
MKKVLKTWTRREFIWLKIVFHEFPEKRKTAWSRRFGGNGDWEVRQKKNAYIHNNIGIILCGVCAGKRTVETVVYAARGKQSARLINSREDLGWSLFIRYRRCCTDGGEYIGSVKTAKLGAVLVLVLVRRRGGRWLYGCRMRWVEVCGSVGEEWRL